MFNKKKEITMLNKKVKKLRIKLLNNMKKLHTKTIRKLIDNIIVNK